MQVRVEVNRKTGDAIENTEWEAGNFFLVLLKAGKCLEFKQTSNDY
jgi:hypothetical protein